MVAILAQATWGMDHFESSSSSAMPLSTRGSAYRLLSGAFPSKLHAQDSALQWRASCRRRRIASAKPQQSGLPRARGARCLGPSCGRNNCRCKFSSRSCCAARRGRVFCQEACLQGPCGVHGGKTIASWILYDRPATGRCRCSFPNGTEVEWGSFLHAAKWPVTLFDLQFLLLLGMGSE